MLMKLSATTLLCHLEATLEPGSQSKYNQNATYLADRLEHLIDYYKIDPCKGFTPSQLVRLVKL